MEKGVVTENVSRSIILQMGCLSGLVAVENILLVHPGSSHKAHQELISISTKAQAPEAIKQRKHRKVRYERKYKYEKVKLN